MNNKIYRLLRNNKEQGSFAYEELIQKGLKPYDLIWVDGRSAAWSYPAEIAEFKMYVPNAEEQGVDTLIRKQETSFQVSSAVQAAVAVNDNLVQAKQKPRYKVSAAWSKIQTVTAPVYNDVMVAIPKKSAPTKIIDTKKTEPVNAKALSWEQAWLDWEHEKKTTVPATTETFTKVPPPAKKTINEAARTTPVLEKKFEQSLDTITGNYIDNILQQKKKSKGFSLGKSSEFILPSIALVVIFSIGYWLMHDDNKTAALHVAPARQQQQIAPANQNEKVNSNINTVAADDNTNTATQSSVQSAENNTVSLDEPVATPVVKEKAPQHYNGNAKFISPVKKNLSSGTVAANKNIQPNSSNTSHIDLKKTSKPVNKQFDPSVINNIPADKAYNDSPANNNADVNASENRPVRRRTNGADISNDQPISQPDNNSSETTKSTKVKSGFNYVKVPEYIKMDNGNGSLRIQNISDVDLDLVVVDVLYYDASSHYRKGETLYLHNLRAGKTVTVKTPRDINSSYATSKVSLVSSDANGVYAVGDN